MINSAANTMAPATPTLSPYISLLTPALLVSIGSMDPATWATSMESASRFGYELVWVVFLANLIALLLHSLASRLERVTGRHLAQACHDEYPSGVCFLLWVFSELSLILLDSAMVLSSAVGLNLVLGIPLLLGILLVAIDVIFSMSFLPLLGGGKTEAFLGVFLLPVVFIFLLNALVTRPSVLPILGGMLPRIKSDNVYAVASLLGANIMPHNLYLSSGVAQERGQLLRHGVYGSILTRGLPVVVNLAVMVVAATTFHNAGFAALTLQDGYVVMEQVLSHAAAPLAFGLALIGAGLLSTMTGTLVAQVTSEGLLGRPLDSRAHRLTMRLAAVLVAIICAWSYGNEGVYQLLIFSQATLILQLPFTLIPLIRLTSSAAYMGKNRISLHLEGAAWGVLVFILCMDLSLAFSMLFGQSEDWEGSATWDLANSDPSTFMVPIILTVVTVAVAFLVWLVFTPIRCETSCCTQEHKASLPGIYNADAGGVSLELASPAIFPSFEDVNVRLHFPGQLETLPVSSEVLEMKVADLDVRTCLDVRPCPLETKSLVEATPADMDEVDPDQVKDEEDDAKADMSDKVETPDTPTPETPSPVAISDASGTEEGTPVSIHDEAAHDEIDSTAATEESFEVPVPAEPLVLSASSSSDEKVVNERRNVEEAESGKLLEEEASVAAPVLSPTSCDSPVANDTNDSTILGNECGSFSRLSGLGRAARRQFVAALEEFWGRLFDYHGQPVGPDSASVSAMKSNSRHNNRSFQTHQDNGPYSVPSPRYATKLTNSLDALGGRPHSSLAASRWLFDHNGLSTLSVGGDQRYSSLRQFSYHEDVDSQPATIHGYNIASHARAASVENSRSRGLQLGDFMPAGYYNTKSAGFDSETYSPTYSPSLEGRDVFSPSKADVYAATVDQHTEYDWNAFPNKSVDRWNPLVYRATGELDKSLLLDSPRYVQPPSAQAERAPLSFDDISPSQSHRDGFSIQANSRTDSLWARQPFEQLFGAPGDRPEKAVQSSKKFFTLSSGVPLDFEIFEHLRLCVRKLLQLDGADWLFRFDSGCDEDLVATVAAREKLLLESELAAEQWGCYQQTVVLGVLPCGDNCLWGSSMLVSFGVWCVHRVLELALMESRPELWGKYTYVLNRLQGILEPAFTSGRIVSQPCKCVQGYQLNGKRRPEESVSYACPWSWGRNTSNPNGKPATGLLYLEMIKEVETAVGGRKGRTGTAAGDVAFPKGKENLASVLKRYKRRLGNKNGNGCTRRSSC